MSTQFFNYPKQAASTANALNTSGEFGRISSTVKVGDISSKHLLMVYISRTARSINGRWLFSMPTLKLAGKISLSTQQTSKLLRDLTSEGYLIIVKRNSDKSFVYEINPALVDRRDHLIPISLVLNRNVTLSFKLFILKLHKSMPPNTNDVRVFKSNRELRSICNDNTIINENIAELERRGLIEHSNTGSKIYLKDVYISLAEELLTEQEERENIVTLKDVI